MLAPEYIPGEFDEPSRSPSVVLIRRVLGLSSDFFFLALLSPFFVGWLLYRGAMHLKRSLH
ncbi:MAG: hypothetical protein QM780_05020 [Hyphomicrobium sp.]|uniref:hypothetical protein n=1 Tax=Hyphomicrobium sp. TaxID=82 RepID=UPI0039E41E38